MHTYRLLCEHYTVYLGMNANKVWYFARKHFFFLTGSFALHCIFYHIYLVFPGGGGVGL